jgi:hypothetical protein
MLRYHSLTAMLAKIQISVLLGSLDEAVGTRLVEMSLTHSVCRS